MDDELLMAYFKGEVSDEEAQRITEWIEAKIEHQRYYQQLCRLFEMSYWIEDIPEQTEVVVRGELFSASSKKSARQSPAQR